MRHGASGKLGGISPIFGKVRVSVPARALRKEQKDLTRERILEAATRLLADSGYASLRVAAVAKEAGVSLGGQLHHFPTKDDLVLAVLERLSIQIIELARTDASQADGNPDVFGLIAESARRFYATEEFLIFLDIFLSVRRHSLFGDAAKSLMSRERTAVEQVWKPHLVKRGVDGDRALAIIRAIWALARGQAISSSEEHRAANETVMSLVIEALKAELNG